MHGICITVGGHLVSPPITTHKIPKRTKTIHLNEYQLYYTMSLNCNINVCANYEWNPYMWNIGMSYVWSVHRGCVQNTLNNRPR